MLNVHRALANHPDAMEAFMRLAVRRMDRYAVECVTGMLDGDGEFASHAL